MMTKKVNFRNFTFTFLFLQQFYFPSTQIFPVCTVKFRYLHSDGNPTCCLHLPNQTSSPTSAQYMEASIFVTPAHHLYEKKPSYKRAIYFITCPSSVHLRRKPIKTLKRRNQQSGCKRDLSTEKDNSSATNLLDKPDVYICIDFVF